MHPVCHLDDARRRDTGEHIDTTGGWHDAGDLRKWVSATVLNGIALMELLRNLGDQWDAAGSGAKALLEEARWGNIYFLKMQDKDGYVWNDVAGGVNGDNSDNHWTDNRTGTPDDRYINTGKSGGVQALFTLFEGMMANAFRASDGPYSEALSAGRPALLERGQPFRRHGRPGLVGARGHRTPPRHRQSRIPRLCHQLRFADRLAAEHGVLLRTEARARMVSGIGQQPGAVQRRAPLRATRHRAAQTG